MAATSPRSESYEARLIRLLAKAREDGIRLYRDPRDGRHYATSASDPGHLYYLTGFSCDCLGFASTGGCKHYAALMSALGWIGGDVAPDPEPIFSCLTCCDEGTVEVQRSYLGGGAKTRYRVFFTAVEACPDCTPAANVA